MTYNFDPERWYENQRAVLEARHRRGDLDDQTLATALTDLDQRYDEMLDRLDGTYAMPDQPSSEA